MLAIFQVPNKFFEADGRVIDARARIGTRPGGTRERAEQPPSCPIKATFTMTSAVPRLLVNPCLGRLGTVPGVAGTGDIDVALPCFGPDIAWPRSQAAGIRLLPLLYG